MLKMIVDVLKADRKVNDYIKKQDVKNKPKKPQCFISPHDKETGAFLLQKKQHEERKVRNGKWNTVTNTNGDEKTHLQQTKTHTETFQAALKLSARPETTKT